MRSNAGLNLIVRCNRAILGDCENGDCPHNKGHFYDEKTCNPRLCKVHGTPSRCIEAVNLCQHRADEQVKQEGD